MDKQQLKNFDKHTNGSICQGCDERLFECAIYLRGWFKYIKEKHPETHISWGHRDEESQEEAFKAGATRLHFPDSKHNFLPSRAVDVFQLVNGKAVFDKSFYKQLKQESEDGKWELRFGQDMPHLGDFDHFEMIKD